MSLQFLQLKPSLPGPDQIYRTVDKGTAWEGTATLSKDFSAKNCGNPEHFYFQDALHGWLAYQEGCLFKTVDGGRHSRLLARAGHIWVGVDGLADQGALFFDSSTTGWVLGQDCQIHETFFGGASWRTIGTAEPIQSFYCRSFPASGMRCWAIGTRLWELR